MISISFLNKHKQGAGFGTLFSIQCIYSAALSIEKEL